MERRVRPRLIPGKNTMALLSGFHVPVSVVDYCATGVAVKQLQWPMDPGKNIGVDILVEGRLCACNLPGSVRWSEDDRTGIRLDLLSETQKKTACDLEFQIMF